MIDCNLINHDVVQSVKQYFSETYENEINNNRFIYLLKTGTRKDRQQKGAFKYLIKVLKDYSARCGNPLVMDCTGDILCQFYQNKFDFKELLKTNYSWENDQNHYVLIFDHYQSM